LDERGERPDVIVGTSVGAINAAYVAATAADPVASALAKGAQMWSEIEFDDVLRPLVSPAELAKALGAVADFLGFPGGPLWGLLEPTPLAGTLARLVAFERIHENVGGPLTAAAVVATSARTAGSVVFHDGGGDVATDRERAIDYVPAELTADHVRASAAIPGVFPAVEITTPAEASGWYFDGGTRLNTPIKPALALGAERVVVIALNSLVAGGPSERPDALDGASQLVQAVLVDPLVHDVQTLATINTVLAGRRATEADGASAHRQVPYIFVAPQDRNAIGAIASRVYREHYTGLVEAARSSSLALLGHALDAGASPARGELFSYLFFAPEFAAALMELGREDARRWLDRGHDDGPWRLGPL
jgi:NTE family protein